MIRLLFSTIDEYREYQQDTNSLLTSIPFGTGAYDYVPISGSCIARGGDASNEGGTNRTTVAGETLRFYHARIGTGGNTYAYRWRAETSLTQKTQTSTSAGSLQTFYSNVAIIDNSAKVCAPTANLYNWTLGAFANGTPTPEIYSEMRGWARPWVRSWDVSGTYVPRAGISHEPTLTLVQAQEPCPGTECVYTPPDGGTGGTGDTTIDTDSEAGACNQISGNWFTKFWQNIESTFQCVFIPTISPVAEWQSVVNEANERIPFSYVSSIVYEGGNLCNMRDFSQLPESGDMENLQFESFACSGGVIEVQLPFSGIPYLEARDTRLRIDLLNNPVGLWMQNIGKHILWALLLLGFYYKLVIYAFSNQWVVSNDN